MAKVLERVGKAIDTLSGVYCYIGMTAVFIFGILITFEAVARFFGFATIWIHWGSIAVIATIPFFTAPYVMREFRHVRVSIFEEWMQPHTRIYSQLFGYFMFFSISFMVHDMETIKAKCLTVGSIFAVDILCLLIFCFGLKWI